MPGARSGRHRIRSAAHDAGVSAGKARPRNVVQAGRVIKRKLAVQMRLAEFSGRDVAGIGKHLEGKTVHELRSFARNARIRGRSKMNKAALVQSLRKEATKMRRSAIPLPVSPPSAPARMSLIPERVPKRAKPPAPAKLQKTRKTSRKPRVRKMKKASGQASAKPKRGAKASSVSRDAFEKMARERASRLKDAGLDQGKLLNELAAMRADKAIRKKHLIAIADRYGADSSGSVAKIYKSIEQRQNMLIYNRDADAMARKATPW